MLSPILPLPPLFLVGLDLVSVVGFVIGRTDYKRRVLEEVEEEDANSGETTAGISLSASVVVIHFCSSVFLGLHALP